MGEDTTIPRLRLVRPEPEGALAGFGRPLRLMLLLGTRPEAVKLAPVILEQLSKALERLRDATNITILLGEQNVTFALPHADRVYVLEHARIVWEGEPGRFAKEAGTGYL